MERRAEILEGLRLAFFNKAQAVQHLVANDTDRIRITAVFMACRRVPWHSMAHNYLIMFLLILRAIENCHIAYVKPSAAYSYLGALCYDLNSGTDVCFQWDKKAIAELGNQKWT